jgi:hypothetical protein
MASLPNIWTPLVPPELFECPDMDALQALVGTSEGRAWVDRRWQQHLADIQAKPEGARSSWEAVELQKPSGWLFTKLNLYYRDAVKGDGAVKRQYHFSAKADRKVARMYTGERTGAAQNLEKMLRSLLFCDKGLDLDVVNCQPTVMSQLANKLGVQCPKLNLIVARREEQLDIVQQIKGIDYASAKQVVIALCNGGGSMERHPYLSALYQECQQLTTAVCSAYSSVYDKEHAKNKRAKLSAAAAHEKARRTTVSRVYQCIESQLLMALYDACLAHDITVMALIFDGMLIAQTHLPDTFLSDVRAYMNQATGFDVKVVLKPMKRVTLADILPKQQTAAMPLAAACNDGEMDAYYWFDDAPAYKDVQHPKQSGHKMVVPCEGEYPEREWTCTKGYLTQRSCSTGRLSEATIYYFQ